MELFNNLLNEQFLNEINLKSSPLQFNYSPYSFATIPNETPMSLFFAAKHGNENTDFFYKISERAKLIDQLTNFDVKSLKKLPPKNLIHQIAISRLSAILLYFSRQSPSRAILPATTFAISDFFDKILEILPDKEKNDLIIFDNLIKKLFIFVINFLLNSNTIFLEKDIFKSPEILENFKFEEKKEKIEDPILNFLGKILENWFIFSENFSEKNYENLKFSIKNFEKKNFSINFFDKKIFNINLSKNFNFDHEPISESLIYPNHFASKSYYDTFISHNLTEPMPISGILSKFSSILTFFENVKNIDFKAKFEALSSISAFHDAFNVSFINYPVAASLAEQVSDSMIKLALLSSRSLAPVSLSKQIGNASFMALHLAFLDARLILPGEEALFVYSLKKTFAEHNFELDLDFKAFYSNISAEKLEMIANSRGWMICEEFVWLEQVGIELEDMHFMVLKALKKVKVMAS